MTEAFDPQALLAQAMDMQQRLMEAQAEAAAETVEGTSGGGKVRVMLRGTGEVASIRIDPSVVVADEVDLLEDLIVAAFHDAGSKVAELAQQHMPDLGNLFGGGEGGGLGGLAELFGGSVTESIEAPSQEASASHEALPPGDGQP